MSEEDYAACRPKKRRSSSILRTQVPPPNPAENNVMMMGEQTKTLRRVSWAEKPTVKLFDSEADTCVKLSELDADSCAMSICSSVQAENNEIATDQSVRISAVMSLCTNTTVRSLNYEGSGTGIVDMVVESESPIEEPDLLNNCHVTEEIEDDLTADMMSAFSKKFTQFTAHSVVKTAESKPKFDEISHSSKLHESSNNVKNGLNNVVQVQNYVEVVKNDEKVAEPIRMVSNTEIQEKDDEIIISTNETGGGQSSSLIVQAQEQEVINKVQTTSRQQQRLADIQRIKADSDAIRAEIKQTIEKIEAAELKLSLINSSVKYGPNFGSQVT